MKDVSLMLGQLVVGYAVLEFIAYTLAMVVLYYVVRYAVRDGIDDSRLGRARFIEPRADAPPPVTTRTGAGLPDMRADR